MEPFEIQDTEPADLHPLQPETLTPRGPSQAARPPRLKPSPPEAPQPSRRHSLWLLAVIIVAGAYLAQDNFRRVAAEILLANPTDRGLDLAVALAPSHPQTWRTRAEWLDRRDSDTGAAAADLAKAVAAAPNDHRLRIELALQLERLGRLDDAEARFREAAAASPGFEPRWNLANFFLRRGRQEDFWTALSQAVATDPASTAAAAALCWRSFDDPTLILDRAMPDDPEVNRRYFAYLAAKGDLDATREAWPRFSSTMAARDVSLAGQYVDELIAAGEVSAAVEAWNSLIDRGHLSHLRLAPEEGQSLTNGQLLREPSSFGFDWRTLEQRGVSWILRPPDRGLSRVIEFGVNGAQGRELVMMRQYAPVVPDASYTFKFEYATRNMPSEPGMGWAISDASDGESLLDFEDLAVAESYWDEIDLSFQTGPETALVALEFGYRAVPGVERTIGRFVLRRLDLRLENN